MNVHLRRTLAVTSLGLIFAAGCSRSGAGSAPVVFGSTPPTLTPTTTPATTTPATTAPTATATPTTSSSATPTPLPTLSPAPTPAGTFTPAPAQTPVTQTGSSCPGFSFTGAQTTDTETLVYGKINTTCGGVGPFVFVDGSGNQRPGTVIVNSYDATRIRVGPANTGTTLSPGDSGTYFSFTSIASGNSTINITFNVMNSDGSRSIYTGIFNVVTNY